MQVENSLESVNLKRLNDAMKLAKEQLYGLSEERKTIHWVSVQLDMYDFFNSTRFYCPYCKEMRFEVTVTWHFVSRFVRRFDKIIFIILTIFYAQAVNERKAEIENNRTLNVNKSKALLEAVNRLKVQIQEMDGRTDKLKGR